MRWGRVGYQVCRLWLLFDWLGPDSSSRFRACCMCWSRWVQLRLDAAAAAPCNT